MNHIRMKRQGRKAIGLFSLMMTVAFSSCGVDFESSNNGPLDGFWHLESVDSLAVSDSMATVDYSNRRVFWSIEAKLINVNDIDRGGAYLLRFRQTGDSLILHTPYVAKGHENEGGTGGDFPVTDASLLAPYGINGLEDHFLKEALDGKKMILRSKMLRLRFRKF